MTMKYVNILMVCITALSLLLPTTVFSQPVITNNPNPNKVVMINFDDGYRNQFLLAKPILDRLGFKATFFIPCAKMGLRSEWMTWDQITGLKNDGMDIESHTMTHRHLTDFLNNDTRLVFEIAGSKTCLANHGFPTSIFAYPLGLGDDEPKIVDIVAKYYSFARSGSEHLMFLNCQGFKGVDKPPQPDCRTYDNNNTLTYANRYDIRAMSFRHITNLGNFTDQQLMDRFVTNINKQLKYNTPSQLKAIPILTFHDVTNDPQQYAITPSTITTQLFEQMMQYLHDNGFTVLVLNQIQYDDTKNVFFIPDHN